MEPLRLPSDEEIGAAYDQGKEAVIEIFISMDCNYYSRQNHNGKLGHDL